MEIEKCTIRNVTEKSTRQSNMIKSAISTGDQHPVLNVDGQAIAAKG